MEAGCGARVPVFEVSAVSAGLCCCHQSSAHAVAILAEQPRAVVGQVLLLGLGWRLAPAAGSGRTGGNGVLILEAGESPG